MAPTRGYQACTRLFHGRPTPRKPKMLTFSWSICHAQQIQHPTAALIARTATAQDDVTGEHSTPEHMRILVNLVAWSNHAAFFLS